MLTLRDPNRRSHLACSLLLSAGLAGCPAVDRQAHAAPAGETRHVSERASFRVVEVVNGLEYPWGVACLPDGDLLITEQTGGLRRVRDGELEPRPIPGTPEVASSGQGGLLDIALDPDFETNRRIYLSYSGRKGRLANTSVMRARYGPEGLSDQVIIFEAHPSVRSSKHFGSRLAFAPDGRLFITLGDRGERWRAQARDDHYGSIVRIEADGSVPSDNPFAASPDALPEIYSIGHRNPQGLAVEPGSGRIYAHEHGPRGGDELNRILPGANFGWPAVTFGREYSGRRIGDGKNKPGMTMPLWDWTPSIAPSGMAFYTGDAFPAWRGNLFVGALRHRMLVRLELEGERVVHEERLLENALGRIRDVRAGPDGLLYVLTDENPGTLYRLEPTD
jgi:glucose/arabinose dehydrogenase